MAHPDYHAIQTGTHVLPDEGLQRITFQAVTPAIYGALAAIVGVTPDDEKYCQMVTTVTRVGEVDLRHGGARRGRRGRDDRSAAAGGERAGLF
jgi:hypothetical protein